MSIYERAVGFIGGFIRGIFGWPDDDEDLKAERVQFWKDQLAQAWMYEGQQLALLRTIVCSDKNAAQDMAKRLRAKLADYGYTADVLASVGSVISVRLTTPSAGRLTERDYAAAVLIDLVS